MCKPNTANEEREPSSITGPTCGPKQELVKQEEPRTSRPNFLHNFKIIYVMLLHTPSSHRSMKALQIPLILCLILLIIGVSLLLIMPYLLLSRDTLSPNIFPKLFMI